MDDEDGELGSVWAVALDKAQDSKVQVRLSMDSSSESDSSSDSDSIDFNVDSVEFSSGGVDFGDEGVDFTSKSVDFGDGSEDSSGSEESVNMAGGAATGEAANPMAGVSASSSSDSDKAGNGGFAMPGVSDDQVCRSVIRVNRHTFRFALHLCFVVQLEILPPFDYVIESFCYKHVHMQSVLPLAAASYSWSEGLCRQHCVHYTLTKRLTS